MLTIQELFVQEKAALAQRLSAERDVDAAVDEARACLDRMRQAYIVQQDNQRMRREATHLFTLANAAVAVLGSARDTQVHARLATEKPGAVNLRLRKTWRDYIGYAPVLLCILTSVMLFADGNTFMILLSLAATVGCGWLTVRQQRTKAPAGTTLPAVQAEVLVDAQALLSSMEGVCVVMDRLLAQEEEQSQQGGQRPQWTQEQLSAVQMLWEAMRTGDGEYALKAVPQMLDALERQELELVLYTPEQARYFEMIPAEIGGQTIRPALVSGKTLLARGQVTVPMH